MPPVDREVKVKIKVDDKEVDHGEASLNRLGAAAKRVGASGDDIKKVGIAAGAVGGLVASAATRVEELAEKVIEFAVEAAKKLFEITKGFAEYAEQVGNASKRTGLTVGTMSALRVELESIGGNFGELQDSIGNYIKLIGDASKGSANAQDKMKRLGLDAKEAGKDIEESFAQVVKRITSLRTPTEQANAAIDAFGEQGYKLLPFFKSFNGDMEELIKKAKSLGLELSDNDVRASKEFNDALKEVQDRAKGLGFTFARELREPVKQFFDDTNNWLDTNKGKFKEWAETISSLLNAVKLDLEQEKNDLGAIGEILDTLNPFSNKTWDGLQDRLQKYTTESARIEIARQNPNRPNNYNPIVDDYADRFKLPSGVIPPTYLDPKEKKPKTTRTDGEAEMRRFFTEMGFTVTRTLGDALNKGSLHPLGRAADVSIKGKSEQQITELIAAAIEHGYRLFDERVKRAGVFQTGPHLHFERNQNKASDFLGQGYYSAPLGYLRDLDKRRLNKGTISSDEIERYLTGQSDQVTKAERDKNTRTAIEIYKRAGLIPTGDLMDRVRDLMVEEAKKAGTIQPTVDDIAKQLGRGGTIAPTSNTLGITAIQSRKSVDQEYIASLRDALGTEQTITELVLARRNYTERIATLYSDSIHRQALDLLNVETQIAVLEKQNSNEEFVRTRRTLEAKQEQLSLEQQITALRDQIANAGVNDGLILESEQLRNILDYRNRELNAVIEIQRAQFELSHSMEISENQIRAGVYNHLAQQRTLNQAIADGINGTYDALAEKQDALIDNLFRWAGAFKSLFTEPLKALARNNLTNVTTKILDAVIPGLGEKFNNATANPIAKPIVDKLTKTNEKLDKIVTLLGGSAVPGLGGGLGSILGGLNGGSLGGLGGGVVGGGGSGPTGSQGGSIFDRLKGIFSTDDGGDGEGGAGGIFQRRGGSRAAGIAGGIGDLVNIAGGLIGGRVGGILSAVGSGASIGAMFGPWGAAIGAGIGLIAGLFQGDPKRKKDKQENIPALNKGFGDAITELNKILDDMRHMTIDPDDAISRAAAVRAEIAGGFGIQFLSKKYRKQSQQMISSKLGEADRIIEQIKSSAEIARGAADRSKRILPEFAAGNYFADFFRPNGLMPGAFDGRDNILAMISRGEMVLNPRQIHNVRSLAGFDVFAGAGIPNYPNPSPSPKLAIGGVAGASLLGQGAVINFSPNVTLIAEGITFDQGAKLYLESDDGRRQLVKVVTKETTAVKR